MAKGGRPFDFYVVKTESCWLFRKFIDKKGYGYFWDIRKHKRVAAHRYSYERVHGELLSEIHLHHRPTCPKNCVNPEHLTPTLEINHPDNITTIHRNKTHCPKGHPYDESNTYVSHNGSRHCRKCTGTKRPSRRALPNSFGREMGDVS